MLRKLFLVYGKRGVYCLASLGVLVLLWALAAYGQEDLGTIPNAPGMLPGMSQTPQNDATTQYGSFRPSVPISQIRQIGGTLFLDADVEPSGVLREHKFVELVAIGTPTAAAQNFRVWYSSVANSLCVKDSSAVVTCLNSPVPDSRLSSNVDLLNSTQTFTAWKTFSSPTASSFTFGIYIGSVTGAGLATCGDATHAVAFSAVTNQFSCQAISPPAGVPALAISTGGVSTNTIISSPTANVVFDSNTFVVVLASSTTPVVYVSSAGVLYASSATATYLTQSSAAVTYITQSSAAVTYLTQSSAAVTYLQSSSATATYLTLSSASATYGQLKATQTWSGQQVWSSPQPSSFTFTVNAGSYTGAGLTTCGDVTHALGWNAGQFSCQNVPGAGGGVALAVSSGSATNSVIVTSPTLNVDFDSHSFTVGLQGSTTDFIQWRAQSRRPVLQFVNTSTITIEQGIYGSSGVATLLFPDGSFRTETATASLNLWIGTTAVWGVTQRAGIRSGETLSPTNQWLSVYAVESTNTITDFVLVGTTVNPSVSSFTFLNTQFGANAWMYLGLVPVGDNSGATTSVLKFTQSGNVTHLFNVCTGNALSLRGIRYATSASATTISYTYAAGSTVGTQIPSNISFGLWTAAKGAVNASYAVKNQASTYFLASYNPDTTDKCSTMVWNPVTEGILITTNTGDTEDLDLSGYIDNALGVSMNSML